MKKYTSLAILFSLFLMPGSTILAETIVEKHTAANFGEFARIVKKHKEQNPKSGAICFVDLDDTTLLYPEYVGSEKWFGRLINGFAEQGIKDPMPHIFLALLTAHQLMINRVTLTENSVAGIYSSMQNMLGIPVIGLTSRTYILSDITKEQLNQPTTKIKFSHPWNSDILLNDDPIWKAMYKNDEGVAYCSGKNKGEISLNLLRLTNFSFIDELSNEPKEIDTIIVLDNDSKHLDRIQEILTKNNVPVRLIRVSYQNPDLPQIEENKIAIQSLIFQISLVVKTQQQMMLEQEKALEEQKRRLLPYLSSSAPATYYSFSNKGHEKYRPERPGSCPPLGEWPN